MDNRKRRRQRNLATTSDGNVRNAKRRRRVSDWQKISENQMVGKVDRASPVMDKPFSMEIGNMADPVAPDPSSASSLLVTISSTNAEKDSLGVATEIMTKGTSLEEKRRTYIVTPRPSLVEKIPLPVQKELDVNSVSALVTQSSVRTIETSETMSSDSSVSSLEMACSDYKIAEQAVCLHPETPAEIHVKQPLSEDACSAVAEETNDEPSLRRKAGPRPLVRRVIGLLTLLLCLAAYTRWSHSHLWKDIDPTAIFVPGAGFSGFWYTLGRLQSIQDPAARTYYCYSAGCLGVVASLSNLTVEEVSDMAFGVQDRWNSGTIHRHDVVDDFVDQLLHSDKVIRPMESEHLLSRLNIITTVSDGWFGVKPCVRTPANIDSLREMLLQTTWIPFAVGHSMWHKDSETGEQHIDGAFSIVSHPLLTNHLHLPIAWDVIANVLNVNLGRRTVKKLWNDGIGHGV